MSKTGHGLIGHKLKGGRWNLVDKKNYQVSIINTDWIEYFPKTLVKK